MRRGWGLGQRHNVGYFEHALGGPAQGGVDHGPAYFLHGAYVGRG